MPITGGCRCGEVRYRLAVAASPVTYACHCTICQRATGSSFAHQMPVREAALEVSGELVEVALTTLQGSVTTHRHCARCLTRVYNTNASRPGLAIMRAGTVDGSETLSPSLHIYTSTRQPWIVLPDGIAAYPENAPAEEWAKLFA
jgi:hypothetical protein